MKVSDMNYYQKLVYYAGAKRITAREFNQVKDNKIVSRGWLARLRGTNFLPWCETKEEAIASGRALRDEFIKEAKEKCLLENEG